MSVMWVNESSAFAKSKSFSVLKFADTKKTFANEKQADLKFS